MFLFVVLNAIIQFRNVDPKIYLVKLFSLMILNIISIVNLLLKAHLKIKHSSDKKTMYLQ